ncbi:hypothetical protein HNQ77_002678 [Silvibacterium bohemicum]|uniref:Uncharacterized protein n=1 Tax=Silvibacterium bohemicum TaxID=1577686 RepID=A0A841JTJ0_9BACT|nr:hypothetical protein [Silvibacterium bohemicum]MBB6144722.1 hypothetical protein [Silvibacterium bohemicum]
MKIQITQTFTDPSSASPVFAGHKFEVGDDLGQRLIREGKAVALDVVPQPAKRKREQATR